MSIDFYFEPGRQGDQSNKDTVNLTIDKFGEESEYLRNLDILFYFRVFDAFGSSLGSTHIRDFPSYEYFIRYKNNHKIDSEHLSDFSFIVEISNDVRARKEEIYKVFTITHEPQHILQFQDNKETFCHDAVIHCYRKTKSENWHEIAQGTPTEVDARRKSKIIAIKWFGEKDVDSFLEEEMGKEPWPNAQDYWKKMRELDIKETYDWKIKTAELWETYEKEMPIKYRELTTKRESSKLGKAERDFLQMFEFCCRYLKRARAK